MCSSTRFLLQIAIATIIIATCNAIDHIVGNSVWSIPPSNDFYSNWSDNKTFYVGDTLVFRFDTGLSDVTQVSRTEFENCTAENVFRRILIGPAEVSLIEQGVYYFICSFGNYCRLGQKLSVPVQFPPE
ncbi:umecyanin-like [Asparagus officinalis]|uniref:umecyanin-like n=1 Tax=Asparagus officinalis TaxID=4686 RepID=UPI00098DFE6C|nr:umecyanin-like [Asparagus officinalis]